MKKVMVFSAHPDDETLGAGGTILRHISQGDEVYWVVFTLYLSDSDEEYKNYRIELVNRVASEYGFSGVFTFDFPAGELDRVGYRNLIDRTIKVVKKVKPDIVYTVGASDINTDHDYVHRTVMVATKPVYGVKEIYAYEIPSSTNWAFSEKSSWFKPNLYVDIERFMDRKMKILSLFEDQIFEYLHARSLESVKALAMYRGSSVGFRYAEAFMVLRILR